jgi:hypothetical protein
MAAGSGNDSVIESGIAVLRNIVFELCEAPISPAPNRAHSADVFLPSFYVFPAPSGRFSNKFYKMIAL